MTSKRLARTLRIVSLPWVFAPIVLIGMGFCALFAFLLLVQIVSIDTIAGQALLVFLVAVPILVFATLAWLGLRKSRSLPINSDALASFSITPSEDQKRHLFAEVDELAEFLGVPSDQLSDLRSAYIVAEDLALRQVQKESKAGLLRHVRIGENDFSAVYSDTDLVCCVQVAFMVSVEPGQEKIDKILHESESVEAFLRNANDLRDVRLVFAIVTQLDAQDEIVLKKSLINKFSDTPIDVDIRLLDFQILQQDYSELAD